MYHAKPQTPNSMDKMAYTLGFKARNAKLIQSMWSIWAKKYLPGWKKTLSKFQYPLHYCLLYAFLPTSRRPPHGPMPRPWNLTLSIEYEDLPLSPSPHFSML